MRDTGLRTLLQCSRNPNYEIWVICTVVTQKTLITNYYYYNYYDSVFVDIYVATLNMSDKHVVLLQ